jgi:replication factor C small subunit
MNQEKQLWREKYRPKTIDDYVWVDQNQRDQVERWIDEKNLPDLLLSGPAGIGKSSASKMILSEIGVDPSDIKYINASKENKIDDFRNLENFIDTMPMGEFKYVILDEADRITSNAMDLLKNMMEEYSSTCRWILTTNHPNKITPPIKSRCVWFHFEKLDWEQFLTRSAHILMAENIELDDDALDILQEYVTASYPDLRKCINYLQQNSRDGKLHRPSASSASSGTQEYLVTAISHFKTGDIKRAREIISANVQENDYEDIYRLLYRNLNWWGTTENQQNAAVIQIANRLRDHAVIADPEICLSALLIELAEIANQ